MPADNNSLLIVADENMPGVEACAALLDRPVTIRRLPGRTLVAADVADADILLVRSVTRVDAALLAGSRVRFVGTATIGTDHLDIPWLEARGITWASAPGCNARAVAEWVLSVLLMLAVEQGRPLAGRRLGIIGLGHVGRWLARLAPVVGLEVSASDPLLDPTMLPPDLQTLPLTGQPALLAGSDIISLHVPLTRGGEHPTWHLLALPELSGLRADCWLINAARGPVIAGQDLLHSLQENAALTAVLDVWEHEPEVDPALLALVRQGSPHIAGHSLEGKWRGTWQIMTAAAEWLGVSLSADLATILPAEGCLDLVPLPAGSASDEARLAELLQRVIALTADDRRLRAAVTGNAAAAAFDALRKSYPLRREFPAHRVHAAADDPLRPALAALGFRLVAGT